MNYLLSTRQSAVVVDGEDLPDEIFATLPSLPSIDTFSTRLAQIQQVLEEARTEADSLRAELREKAAALRGLADALEAI